MISQITRRTLRLPRDIWQQARYLAAWRQTTISKTIALLVARAYRKKFGGKR